MICEIKKRTFKQKRNNWGIFNNIFILSHIIIIRNFSKLKDWIEQLDKNWHKTVINHMLYRYLWLHDFLKQIYYELNEVNLFKVDRSYFFCANTEDYTWFFKSISAIRRKSILNRHWSHARTFINRFIPKANL